MGYLTNLEWNKRLSELSENEQKILLALSSIKYKWRTRDRLMKKTDLDAKTLDKTLSILIEKGFVRPSFSKMKNLIYGLIERVGS